MQLSTAQPTPTTYAALLGACDGSSQWQQAVQLLFEVSRIRLQPDVLIFNLAISACHKSFQWQLALCLLGEMIAHGLAPNPVTSTLAMEASELGQLCSETPSLLSDVASCLQDLVRLSAQQKLERCAGLLGRACRAPAAFERELVGERSGDYHYSTLTLTWYYSNNAMVMFWYVLTLLDFLLSVP